MQDSYLTVGWQPKIYYNDHNGPIQLFLFITPSDTWFLVFRNFKYKRNKNNNFWVVAKNENRRRVSKNQLQSLENITIETIGSAF